MKTINKTLFLCLFLLLFSFNIFCKNINKQNKIEIKEQTKIVKIAENKHKYRAGKLRSRKYIKNYNGISKKYKNNALFAFCFGLVFGVGITIFGFATLISFLLIGPL
jgi:hypothetical protein